MTDQKRVGRVVHYFGKINVAVLGLDTDLKIGDRVHFLGPHTDFLQDVASMQIEHEVVTEAKKGDEVAIKVDQLVRKSDSAYVPAE